MKKIMDPRYPFKIIVDEPKISDCGVKWICDNCIFAVGHPKYVGKVCKRYPQETFVKFDNWCGEHQRAPIPWCGFCRDNHELGPDCLNQESARVTNPPGYFFEERIPFHGRPETT